MGEGERGRTRSSISGYSEGGKEMKVIGGIIVAVVFIIQALLFWYSGYSYQETHHPDFFTVTECKVGTVIAHPNGEVYRYMGRNTWIYIGKTDPYKLQLQ